MIVPDEAEENFEEWTGSLNSLKDHINKEQ